MAYTAHVHDRLADFSEMDWPVDSGQDLAMDRRLLDVFAQTMTGQCRTWFVAVRDDSGRVVARAAACRFVVDGLESTAPRTQALTRGLRRFMPGFMRFGVLFCGLPVPGGQCHIRVEPRADTAAAITAIHNALLKLAQESRSRLVVWREFDKAAVDTVAVLSTLGYLRGAIPWGHTLSVPPGQRFSSIDQYLAALRSSYRRQLLHSRRNFDAGHCNVVALSGHAASAAFTDELHALYIAMRDRAAYRMETFPCEFFRGLASGFGDAAHLTVIERAGRPVAFTFGLQAEDTYHNLYGGIDYALNAELNLYFNLYYHDLDQAFARGCRHVDLGQTADTFKIRLGSTPRPLWFFVRGVNPAVHWGLARFSRWVFPPVPTLAPRDVFRKNAGSGAQGRRAAPAHP